MGNNFPKITTLKEKPTLIEATLKLIEKSFQYKSPNSFKVDFSPLIDESNHHNCFIIIDENEKVLAHIGVKEKFITMNKEKFPIAMLGGIAVDEDHRGEGHFQTLLNDVIAEKRSDVAFFILWSDLEKLYNKFGFHLCGNQLQLDEMRGEKKFEQTKYHLLNLEDKKSIQGLYQSSFETIYLTLNRNEEDWKQIEKITSADLFIKKSGSKITDYFFMNKGQDLPNIIYEYGTINELKSFLKDITAYGKVWTGDNFIETENLQYQFFMNPADLKLFARFILSLSKDQIAIRNINLMKQEVYFDYNEETLSLEIPDFLRGLFGPGAFEELDLRPLFISGLDSI